MKVYLVSPGQTEWSRQNRLSGALDIPLNDAGQAAVEALARTIAVDGITSVYCPTTLDGRQTAAIIARITKAKVYPRRELNQADPGLWQGLTAEELKRRHPHVYARWVKSPASVLPPRGEAFTMIFGRVGTMLAELKRHRTDDVVVCVVPSVIRRILAGRLRGLDPEAAAAELPEHDGLIDMVAI
jgi:broad specificity phosphatase PhoE